MVKMQNNTNVIKHLEMIQGVINRLGHDSFLVKGWSMALLVGGIILVTRSEVQSGCVILAFLIPIVGFWILDGYFLWQERLFREIYNEVREQETTNFEMNPMKHIDKPKRTWSSSIFSITLNIFYGVEILFVWGSFFILKTGGC